MSRYVGDDFDYPRSFHYRYNPNQPRVPRGHREGGQWTSDGYRALSELTKLPPPDMRGNDGDRALYTRYALLQPGDIPVRRTDVPALFRQTDAPGRTPVKPPVRPNVFISALRVLAPLGILWQLYELLSEYNRPDQRVVLGLQAREFRRLRPDSSVFGSVRRLNQEDTLALCPSLKEVQELVDEAAKNLGPRNPYRNSKEDAAYGNALEKEIEKLLPELNRKRKGFGKPPLEWKKTFGPGGELDKNPKEFGVKEPDLTEKDKTACFYQVTSGDPSGVGLNMKMLVENFSQSKYAEGTDIAVVTQVKPTPVNRPSSPLPMPPLPTRDR